MAAVIAALLALAAVVDGLVAAARESWWAMAMAGVLGLAGMVAALLSLRE